MTIDDIEKQRFRVNEKRNSKVKRRTKEDWSNEGYSIVEKAYVNSKETLFSVASYIY